MLCFVLKDGGGGVKGHVSFLRRKDELLVMVEKLPCASLDAAVLRRDAPGSKVKNLRVRWHKVCWSCR